MKRETNFTFKVTREVISANNKFDVEKRHKLEVQTVLNGKLTKPMILSPDMIQETASYLHISISTLYRWVHYRKIEYIKIGSKVLFSENYLKEFIKSNTNIVLD